MSRKKISSPDYRSVQNFLNGKSDHTIKLFTHFVQKFGQIGPVTVHPAKTIIGIATPRKRIAWVTQFGKNFLHVVLPFEKTYPDNLCFIKIAQVPGDNKQFNHHFRMHAIEDVNEEVLKFMQIAYVAGS